jgi:hypothetical protein
MVVASTNDILKCIYEGRDFIEEIALPEKVMWGCRVYVRIITYCAIVYIFIVVIRYTQANLMN